MTGQDGESIALTIERIQAALSSEEMTSFAAKVASFLIAKWAVEEVKFDGAMVEDRVREFIKKAA